MSENPERRNKPAEAMWRASICVPGGWYTILFSEEREMLEVTRFNKDPDGYAAELYHLSKFDYLQWVDLDGAPLCGHRTKRGDLCRNMIGPIQMDAPEWKARHRKGRCTAHGGRKK